MLYVCFLSVGCLLGCCGLLLVCVGCVWVLRENVCYCFSLLDVGLCGVVCFFCALCVVHV